MLFLFCFVCVCCGCSVEVLVAVFWVGREVWWMWRHGGNRDIFGGCRREVGMRGVLWMTNLGALMAAAELQIIDPAFRFWVSLGFIVGLTPFIWTSRPFLVFGLCPIWSLLSYVGFVAF